LSRAPRLCEGAREAAASSPFAGAVRGRSDRQREHRQVGDVAEVIAEIERRRLAAADIAL